MSSPDLKLQPTPARPQRSRGDCLNRPLCLVGLRMVLRPRLAYNRGMLACLRLDAPQAESVETAASPTAS